MSHASSLSGPRKLSTAAGLSIELNVNGSIQRMDAHGVMLNLFPGNEVEGGPANLWLRRHDADGVHATPLLGPLGPLASSMPQASVPDAACHEASGTWQGLRVRLQLRLAVSQPAWFWHVRVDNESGTAQTIDLVHLQDIGLSSHGAIRLNEHYVSHYIDLTPLMHATRGRVVAARQNLAVARRHPWAILGSLGQGVAFATDARQTHGFALREGALPSGVVGGLPDERLQHEHALIGIQDATRTLAPGEGADLGFFGHVLADHPQATQADDLAWVDAALALPEARPMTETAVSGAATAARTLFSTAPWLATTDLGEAELDTLFGARRHEERVDGTLLSFFTGEHTHVVLRAKELVVQRPHGHILRTGSQLVPDETALTSTAWMGGVFHSMVTQGHVSINRFLSTVHSWLGLYRSHGQRVFMQVAGEWRQLGLPSAFQIDPHGCRWIYKFDGGLVELRSTTHTPHALGLRMRVLAGPARRVLVTHHIALGGDDGSAAGVPPLRVNASGAFVGVPAGSALAARFPRGGFRIRPEAGTRFERVGGDELIHEDARPHGQPFVCIASEEAVDFGLRITGALVRAAALPADEVSLPSWTTPATASSKADMDRLGDVLPWYLHNALIHYLSPRGLEQYSGGGWGTRDVCQGPLEMLLALGRHEPVRDLLLRVFAAQNDDGDWPQWFTFFKREREVRAGDSHGDIVFWPLLGLARYLLASGDAGVLDRRLPFFAATGRKAATASLWRHVERALTVIRGRRIEGTHLAAYGDGDWNDSLQPADPELRERMCSAWTVTLHHQVLTTLARALRALGRAEAAASLDEEATAVAADFQRHLVVDGVVTGYALFPPGQPPQMLLHPGDRVTGVSYSLLPMMHAILEDMLSPQQARSHLALIEEHLTGPDGARLFDRPLPYRGGPERLFQRAETSAFFGREIGIMYTHAHLRYAQALAHVGDAQGFFDALCKAHAIGLHERVPSADRRQSNCYFSSSDAAFGDRYQAQREYARVREGSIRLDGGWRIYSSGPGIAIGIVVESLLGIRQRHASLAIDPVMPASMDGLRATLRINGHDVDVEYRVGASGCGPTKLVLNGEDLPFERGANPYRVGAAQVSMEEFKRRLRAEANTLRVDVGAP